MHDSMVCISLSGFLDRSNSRGCTDVQSPWIHGGVLSDIKQGCVRPCDALKCIDMHPALCAYIHHILKRHNILQQAYAIDNLRHTVL